MAEDQTTVAVPRETVSALQEMIGKSVVTLHLPVSFISAYLELFTQAGVDTRTAVHLIDHYRALEKATVAGNAKPK